MHLEIDIQYTLSHLGMHMETRDKRNCMLYRIISVLPRDPNYPASTVYRSTAVKWLRLTVLSHLWQ